jgi:cell division protein FtsB
MREFKKRASTPHTLLRFFAACAGTVILFLLTVVVARAAWNMYDTFKVASDARESAQGQLESLKADQARLTAAVNAFDTQAGMEREIRDRFGVVKPGEGEIEIVRDQGSSTPEAAPSQGGFMRILQSLFVW